MTTHTLKELSECKCLNDRRFSSFQVQLPCLSNRFTASQQLVDAGPSAGFPAETVIARVLYTEPLIIELLDRQHLTGNALKDYGLVDHLFVQRTQQAKLSTLHFNNIITASLYQFTYPAGELAIGHALTDIQKLQEPISYLHPLSRSTSHDGLMVQYIPLTSNDNEFLRIYHDGAVVYRDATANVLSRLILQPSELTGLRELAERTPHLYPSDLRLTSYEPSLAIATQQYYAVGLHHWKPLYSPLIPELDALIQRVKDTAKYRLSYRERFAIKDWHYSNILTLASVTGPGKPMTSAARGELLAELPLPRELVHEMQQEHIYYRDGQKLYGIGMGSCVNGTTGTWACFGASEVSTSGSIPHYQPWPSELGVQLRDIPSQGIEISPEEYAQHKAFYDSLRIGDYHLLYREGDMLYQMVTLSLQ